MSKKINRIEAIIVDYYGTLVYEEEPINILMMKISYMLTGCNVDNNIRKHWDNVFSDYCQMHNGKNYLSQTSILKKVLNTISLHYKINMNVEEEIKLLNKYWSMPPLYPDAKDVMNNCSVPICILSNIDNEIINSAIKYNNIKYDYLITSEDVKHYKPSKEIYNKALEALRINKDNIIMIGNSYHTDIKGAISLGIKAYWVNREMNDYNCENISYVSNNLYLLKKLLSGQ